MNVLPNIEHNCFEDIELKYFRVLLSNMGLTKSRYQVGKFTELPITALRPEDGLFVIYTSEHRYIRQTETIIKLKEKNESWTGDDCVIKDSNDTKWFDNTAPINSRPISRSLMDLLGNEIANYHLQAHYIYGTAYITVQTDSGRFCAATIRRSRGDELKYRCNADIFVHNPLLPLEHLSTMEGKTPDIKVEGNFIAKKYDFMMNLGTISDNQAQFCKIAQVTKVLDNNTELEPESNNSESTYYLRIGANVDIAFICICAYSLEELFSSKIFNKRDRSGGVFSPCSRHNRTACQWGSCKRERTLRFFAAT